MKVKSATRKLEDENLTLFELRFYLKKKNLLVIDQKDKRDIFESKMNKIFDHLTKKLQQVTTNLARRSTMAHIQGLQSLKQKTLTPGLSRRGLTLVAKRNSEISEAPPSASRHGADSNQALSINFLNT